jgi:hypothetical protein
VPWLIECLMIIDTSKRSALTKAQLNQEYSKWKSIAGKYIRHNVCVVYSAGPEPTFAFGFKGNEGQGGD